MRTVSGQAYVLRGELRLKADISLQLKEGDVMTTGSPGSMGVILRDDTVLSLGPDSRLELNQFTFVPAKGEMSLFTRMLKGTATYLSGTIGKLAPEKVKMETPQTTIGIRGTRFLIRVSPP
ncbi:FecR domain-containing protein [Dethiosulfatarculus sandiegensis]|uniref:FecR domain-containing protein n=1 Tax=Dethiosulfatarculus sandiegensis TaxID=1429043 RepID=UPI0018D15FE7|nr:FecR domain-containing protein [Dethiosulfatarculus sandiegensis]